MKEINDVKKEIKEVKKNVLDVSSVPYIIVEALQDRQERIIKTLSIVVIIAILSLLISNALWLYSWLQYDYVAETNIETYSQIGEGINIIGNENEVKKDGANVSEKDHN